MREYIGVERQGTIEVVNNVLRQTYMLLSMLILFCALGSLYAVKTGASPMGFGYIIIVMALFFLINMFRNSGIALFFAILLSTFMGYSIGPLLSLLLQSPATSNIVTAALFSTASIVGGVSLYAINSKTDFSYMQGLYVVGLVFCILISFANYMFFQLPILEVVFVCFVAMLSAVGILWRTSSIVHGGEHNYILAAVALFLDIYNLFVSLLRIFIMISSNRE